MLPVVQSQSPISGDRAFFRASTGLARCFVHFIQTVGTAFGDEFALLQTVRATFNQAFLFQAITATFGNEFALLQTLGTAFNQAFLFQAITATFGDEFAFLQTLGTAFNQAFLFQAIAATFGNGLADVCSVRFDLWNGLFCGWQGKSTGGQDGECNTEQ